MVNNDPIQTSRIDPINIFSPFMVYQTLEAKNHFPLLVCYTFTQYRYECVYIDVHKQFKMNLLYRIKCIFIGYVQKKLLFFFLILLKKSFPFKVLYVYNIDLWFSSITHVGGIKKIRYNNSSVLPLYFIYCKMFLLLVRLDSGLPFFLNNFKVNNNQSYVLRF